MSSETKQILTTDGIPLEVSLKKAERKNKIKAFLLVAPLLFFLIITYVFPIGDMLFRSVDDKMVTQMLPKTFKAIKHKRPFILTIAKQPGELAMLRNLGFETFHSVWDEVYDVDTFHKTVDHMAKLCYNLSNENITELYHATVDICEHNYNVLMNTDWIAWYLNELDKQYDL